jgi:DNA processing protein
VADALAAGLAEAGVCVVSGLARGIDASAHEGAINAGGPTAAVLRCGVNVPYPIENIGLYRRITEGAGVALSEYPMDAAPVTYHFPHRNRVISGLSHGIVFVEGKVKSGGMITVRTALAQGREVFAVPGCIGQATSEGPHAIIREGAQLVTCAEDVLMGMGLERLLTKPHPEPEPVMGVNDTQVRVLRALLREPMGLDSLCETTGLSADELMAELSIMEIMGQIRRDSGNIFAPAIRQSRE